MPAASDLAKIGNDLLSEKNVRAAEFKALKQGIEQQRKSDSVAKWVSVIVSVCALLTSIAALVVNTYLTKRHRKLDEAQDCINKHTENHDRIATAKGLLKNWASAPAQSGSEDYQLIVRVGNLYEEIATAWNDRSADNDRLRILTEDFRDFVRLLGAIGKSALPERSYWKQLANLVWCPRNNWRFGVSRELHMIDKSIIKQLMDKKVAEGVRGRTQRHRAAQVHRLCQGVGLRSP
jgi:hypothetical protein